MALQTYWMSPPISISNGTGSANTPVGGIPAKASVRSYSVLTEYIESDDMGVVASWIDSYVLNGSVVKTGNVPAPAIVMGPGVSQVHATYISNNAQSTFILITDLFF